MKANSDWSQDDVSGEWIECVPSQDALHSTLQMAVHIQQSDLI